MFIAAQNAFECIHRLSFTEFDQFDQHAGGRNNNRNGRAIPDLWVTIVESGTRNTEEDNAVTRQALVADPRAPVGGGGALR